jgi:hypothetical protein
MGTAVVSMWLLVSCAKADSWDVFVELFSDSGCLYDKYGEVTLVDSQCYANTYSTLSKAFTVKMVAFGALPEFDIAEYTDDCQELYTAKRTAPAGACGRWFGPLRAKLSVRPRSTTCTEGCSELSMAVQTFYENSACTGREAFANAFPVQNECLRFFNGTQQFTADSSNVYQKDYPANDDCTGDEVDSYAMAVGQCMPMFTKKSPRSVMWHIQNFPMLTTGTTSGSPPLAPCCSVGIAATLALLL